MSNISVLRHKFCGVACGSTKLHGKHARFYFGADWNPLIGYDNQNGCTSMQYSDTWTSKALLDRLLLSTKDVLKSRHSIIWVFHRSTQPELWSIYAEKFRGSLETRDLNLPFRLPHFTPLWHVSLERSLARSDCEWMLILRLGRSVTESKPCDPRCLHGQFEITGRRGGDNQKVQVHAVRLGLGCSDSFKWERIVERRGNGPSGDHQASLLVPLTGYALIL